MANTKEVTAKQNVIRWLRDWTEDPSKTPNLTHFITLLRLAFPQDCGDHVQPTNCILLPLLVYLEQTVKPKVEFAIDVETYQFCPYTQQREFETDWTAPYLRLNIGCPSLDRISVMDLIKRDANQGVGIGPKPGCPRGSARRQIEWNVDKSCIIYLDRHDSKGKICDRDIGISEFIVNKNNEQLPLQAVLALNFKNRLYELYARRSDDNKWFAVSYIDAPETNFSVIQSMGKRAELLLYEQDVPNVRRLPFFMPSGENAYTTVALQFLYSSFAIRDALQQIELPTLSQKVKEDWELDEKHGEDFTFAHPTKSEKDPYLEEQQEVPTFMEEEEPKVGASGLKDSFIRCQFPTNAGTQCPYRARPGSSCCGIWKHHSKCKERDIIRQQIAAKHPPPLEIDKVTKAVIDLRAELNQLQNNVHTYFEQQSGK